MVSVDCVITFLRSQGIKAIVFDFDNTITVQSRGLVRKDKLASFCKEAIAPFFREALPALLREHFIVGVATFSDGHGASSAHIAGRKLVRAFLSWHFGNNATSQVGIEAACPANYQSPAAFTSLGLSAPMPPNKQHHLDRLAARWRLPPATVALVDDCADHVASARRAGYPAALVRGRGVHAEDRLQLLGPDLADFPTRADSGGSEAEAEAAAKTQP